MKWLKPSSKIFLLTFPRRYFFCGSFVLFMSCVCHAFVSVHSCLVVTCWERAHLLAFVCNVKWCFVPCGILGQVRYLIVLIPALCQLSYFNLLVDNVMNKIILSIVLLCSLKCLIQQGFV